MYFVVISALAVIGVCHGGACDLTAVQTCLGEASDLSSRISLNPVQMDLLTSITQHYCGHGYEDCLKHATGSCSDRELAPYRTIVSTLKLVCDAETQYTTTCLRKGEVRHHLKYCFQLFKADIDHVVGDTMLTTDDVNQGLCRAYNSAATCVYDVTQVLCVIHDTVYINALVRGSMQPTIKALKC